MSIDDLDLGDAVYAAHPIIGDGSMPDGEEGSALAQAGASGLIVMKVLVEEGQDLNLGRPIGCWVEGLAVPKQSSDFHESEFQCNEREYTRNDYRRDGV